MGGTTGARHSMAGSGLPDPHPLRRPPRAGWACFVSSTDIARPRRDLRTPRKATRTSHARPTSTVTEAETVAMGFSRTEATRHRVSQAYRMARGDVHDEFAYIWVMLRLIFISTLISTLIASTAEASVVEHRVAPQNVSTTNGIDVRAEERDNGDIVLTLTIETAPAGVYSPRVRARPGAPEVQVPWIDSDAEPRVARVVVRAADVATAEISVMRDFGLTGHRYVLRVRDWRPRR